MSGVQETGDHAGGQFGLGDERGVRVESAGLAAVGLVGPRAWDVELSVQCGVSVLACVGDVDGDLGVFDSARGAGVLALDADCVDALLHVTGLVDHEYCLVVVQVLDDVVAQVVTDGVGVPLGAAQQVLHGVRSRLPGPFGDGPAVLPREVREQSQHQVPYSATGFDPGKPACNAVHQALERFLPAGSVYAVTCGRRVIVCLHTPMINGGRTSSAS